jgi:hypothetical protein
MRFLLFIVAFFATVNSQAAEMALTKGRAVTDMENLYDCGSRYRKSGIGHVQAAAHFRISPNYGKSILWNQRGNHVDTKLFNPDSDFRKT